MKKFSVIVPVYNKKDYLASCIESVAGKQDCAPMEILLIDDGSTDGSDKICQYYCRQFDNIIYFRQENRGLSCARNRGIEAAEGEYIFFLDADDYLEPNILSDLYAYARGNNLDACTFGWRRHDANNRCINEVYPIGFDQDAVTSGLQYIDKKGQLDVPPMAPLYVLRKGFIEYYHFRFVHGLQHEDNAWTAHWFPHAERIGCFRHMVYHIVHSPNSIMRFKNPKRCWDALAISKLIHEYAEDMRPLGAAGAVCALHENAARVAWAGIHDWCSQGFSLADFFDCQEIYEECDSLLKGDARYGFIRALLRTQCLWPIEILFKVLDSVRGVAR